ncbi:MAG: rod shape-determining protein MreC [Chloroflexi bacterium]|nr:rod shape-determining protein MreC [Chloroflexota bacterium]
MSALLSGGAARRRTVAYVALLTVSLLLVAISSNPLVRDLQNGVAFAFRPVQTAVDGVARDVSSILGTIAEIDRLRLENEALRSENEHLRNENAQAKEIQRQNEELVALLQLRTGLEFQTEPVTVIARESSEARRTVIIDRGSDDGLEAGDVVVAGGGALVGRIATVGPNFARIVLISDSTSTVVGQLLSSTATGQVVGQLGGALIMQDVDSLAEVVVGEEVFTAGIELGGGIRSPYPKGLLIGRVVDVARDPNEVVQTVFLEPAANLDRLEYLLVITNYEGGLTGPLESLLPCEPTDGGTLPDSDQPCASVPPGG